MNEPHVNPAPHPQPGHTPTDNNIAAVKTNQKAVLDRLVHLVSSKPEGYQFTADELLRCGILPEQATPVRQAISRAYASLNNRVLAALGAPVKPILDFLNTVFRFLLFLVAFIVTLQLSTFNQQANLTLRNQVAEAKFKLLTYEKINTEINQKLVELGVSKGKVSSQELDRQLDEAKHWARYDGQSVGNIIRAVPQDWGKLQDLRVIYGKTFEGYTDLPTLYQSVPKTKEPYITAAIISALVVFLYTVILNFLQGLGRQMRRNSTFRRELKKAI